MVALPKDDDFEYVLDFLRFLLQFAFSINLKIDMSLLVQTVLFLSFILPITLKPAIALQAGVLVTGPLEHPW